MTKPASELDTFDALLKSALQDQLDPRCDSFPEMLASDGVMEFPYAPPGAIQKLIGREAVVDYLRAFSCLLELHTLSLQQVYRTDRPDVTIVEFRCEGRGINTGRPYSQRYISVITTNNGFISRYVDYWNPLTVLEAVGGLASLTSAFKGEQA